MLQNLALIAVLAAPQASSVVAQVELAGVTRATGEEEARISGRVELSAPAADQAALEKLGDECRWQLERRAEELLELRRPFWLPEALGRRALDRWLGRVDPLDVVEIVDRSRTERDHGDYVSYQTALVVRTDPQRSERAVARYSRELDRTANRFGAVVGGSVVLWGVSAFLWMWFDRITRGYMTWRLGLVFVGMGAVAPGIALLFV